MWYYPLLLTLLIFCITPASAALVDGIFYFNNITPQNDVLEWQVQPRDTLIQGRSYDLLKVSGFSQIYAHWDDETLAMTDCHPDRIINTSYFGTNGLMHPDNVYLDPKIWVTGNWYQWDGCFNRYIRGQTSPNMVPYSSDNTFVFKIITWKDYQLAITWMTRKNLTIFSNSTTNYVKKNKTPDPILGPWLNGMTFLSNGTLSGRGPSSWQSNNNDNTSYFVISDQPSFEEWIYNPISDTISKRGSAQSFSRGTPPLTQVPTSLPTATPIKTSQTPLETYKFNFQTCLDSCKNMYYPQKIGFYNDCIQNCNVDNLKAGSGNP
jgi:hypothetical protein